MEVMKTPQQRENIFKDLEEENLKEDRMEAIIMTQKPPPKRGRVPPFFISLETNDMIIYNRMVDYGDTHNIMHLSIIRTIGLDYTTHYQVGC